MTIENNTRIIIALDYSDQRQVNALVEQLDPKRVKLKVGKELFTRFGPDLVKQLVAQGFDVFLDLKFHDIPNTVAKACQAAADLGVWMINVHASGGRRMLQAAQESLVDSGQQKPLLVAVTILTSLAEDELGEIGFQGTAAEHVNQLALLAQDCGLDGVVCSAQEALALRRLCQAGFRLVTPGIELTDNVTSDQKRTTSVQQAINNGADYLVIGRAVTTSSQPLEKIKRIELDIAQCIVE
ncbi:MAG: orotidine-5'-phosphate decarboxylase [Gammaproteobacteria bacterium]